MARALAPVCSGGLTEAVGDYVHTHGFIVLQLLPGKHICVDGTYVFICLLRQAFTDAAMRLYLPTILDVCRYTLEQWSASEEPVLFYLAARAFAFDVAATVLTGTRFDGNTLGAWLPSVTCPEPLKEQ